MASFEDNIGRKWEMRITPASMRRTKALLGINLGTVLADNLKQLGEIIADPMMLVDITYCLVKPEADRLGITDEQFGEGLVGDAIERANDAFLEALSDFFPSRQSRVLRTLFKKWRDIQTTEAERAEQTINQLTVTDFVLNSQQPAA